MSTIPPFHCLLIKHSSSTLTRQETRSKKEKTRHTTDTEQNLKTPEAKKIMSSTVVSGTETTLYLFSKPNQSTKYSVPANISCISFSSQVSKSRIYIRNPSGSIRSRPEARIKAFHAPPSTTESLYELLGITEKGTVSEIKKAYKKMARMYHPDVSPPERVNEHTKRFIMVKEAYQVLSNPKTRALYDEDLTKGFPFVRRSSYQHDQSVVKREEWKNRWQSQLDELKRRNLNRDSRGGMSWGDRMRNQR